MHAPRRPPEVRAWTASDGYVLHGRYWPPAAVSAPRTILYLHGIQSHGGWFAWSASLLAEYGAAVMLVDRRGSGLNEADRGDVPTAQRWLADLDDLAESARREHGGPLDLVGVSWGGKLAVAWALARPTCVRRLLLIAPGLFPRVDVGWRGRLRIAAALLTRPTTRIEIPLSDPALFTDNPAGRAFIAGDPLRLTHATARFLYHSARLDRRLRRARPGSLAARTTVLLAGRERIVRNDAARNWVQRVAATPPEIALLADAAHTLEFEPDLRRLEAHLRAWAADGA